LGFPAGRFTITMTLWDVLTLPPLIWIGLSVLVAALLLVLRLRGRLRAGHAFVLADSILAALSAVLGQIYLYAEHRTLNGILCLGIPSVLVAAILGTIQCRLAGLAADTSRARAARDNATIAVVLLAIPVGLLMFVTMVLFGLWATG
jgi:hypothetical protein